MNKSPERPLVMEAEHPGDHADIVGWRGGETLPASLASRRDQMFPRLTAEEINRLRRFGQVRTWKPGEFLFEAGKPHSRHVRSAAGARSGNAQECARC